LHFLILRGVHGGESGPLLPQVRDLALNAMQCSIVLYFRQRFRRVFPRQLVPGLRGNAL